MSTVLKSSDGRRRCDDTCHSAKGAKCLCICGGRFHGASIAQTMDAARAEIAEIVMKKTVRKRAAHEFDPSQSSLFDIQEILNAAAKEK